MTEGDRLNDRMFPTSDSQANREQLECGNGEHQDGDECRRARALLESVTASPQRSIGVAADMCPGAEKLNPSERTQPLE
jgi:hypothetical protein